MTTEGKVENGVNGLNGGHEDEKAQELKALRTGEESVRVVWPLEEEGDDPLQEVLKGWLNKSTKKYALCLPYLTSTFRLSACCRFLLVIQSTSASCWLTLYG